MRNKLLITYFDGEYNQTIELGLPISDIVSVLRVVDEETGEFETLYMRRLKNKGGDE